MEHIVRQLLDFSRRSGLQRREVRADQLAEATRAAVCDEMEEMRATISLHGPRPAPELNVDPLQLQQILTNLLRNAIQAAPDGEVHLSWYEGEGEVSFAVDDSGPGIPPDVRTHIYEPFYTTKPVGQGTGLGLAVVHGIVEQHGGRIEVGTSPLGGARFEVSLPVKRSNGEAN